MLRMHRDSFSAHCRVGLGLAILLATGLSQPVLAENFSCPKPLTGEGSGAVSNGGFKIEFKSWTWEEDSTNRLCHCVRNLNRNPVRIDWPDVGLKSYIRLNETTYAMNYMPDANVEHRQTVLHYGPNTVDVQTIFPLADASGALDDAPMSRPVSAFRLAQAEGYEPAEGDISEESYGRITVPPADLSYGLSLEEIDAMVAEDPNLLQDVEMIFTSTARFDADGQLRGIDYNCTYGVDAPYGQPSIALLIADEAVQRAVFDTTEAANIDWSRLAGGRPVSSGGSIEVSGNADSMQTITTTMQVVGLDGLVYGSMPIRVQALR